MDYTIGAIDVPADAAFKAVLTRLGPPAPGPRASLTRNHLRDLVKDRRGYCLRRPALEAAVAAYCRPRRWITDVCDCDSKTICAASELIDMAVELGYQFGLWMFWLDYVPSSAELAPSDRLRGYHDAPLFLTYDDAKQDLDVVVVQPPHRYENGATRGAIFAPSEQEVRFYTGFGGLA